jgi:hypothetical protein
MQALTRIAYDKNVYSASKKNSIALCARDVLFRNAATSRASSPTLITRRRIGVDAENASAKRAKKILHRIPRKM